MRRAAARAAMATAALGLALTGCTASTTGSSGTTDRPGTTAVVEATDGTVAPVATGTVITGDVQIVVSAGSGELAVGAGVVKVTLHDAPAALWITDGAGRTAGSLSTEQLVDDWEAFGFVDEPPTAAIESDGKAISFTIEEIELDDGDLVTSGPLHGETAEEVDAMPTEFGAAALFIDATDATPPGGDEEVDCDDVEIDWPLTPVADGELLTASDYNTWVCALNELHGRSEP